MLARELKAAPAVIEEGDRPARRVLVALAAVSPIKLRAVHALGVAEGALRLGVIFKLCPVRVTAITGLLLMTTIEGEARDRVVEVSLLPADRRVTLGAGLPLKGVTVRVII